MTMEDELFHSFKNLLLARARVDEATIKRWLLNGMEGKLVRRGDGPIRVEPCPPEDNGQFVVYHYQES